MLAQTVGRAVAGAKVVWAVEFGALALHHCVYEGDDAMPDVLLLDMSLTDIPGPDVCRRIREAQDRTAILCITSYSLEHYRQSAIEAGAQGLISKSVTPRELAEAIGGVARNGTFGEGFMTAQNAKEALSAASRPGGRPARRQEGRGYQPAGCRPVKAREGGVEIVCGKPRHRGDRRQARYQGFHRFRGHEAREGQTWRGHAIRGDTGFPSDACRLKRGR